MHRRTTILASTDTSPSSPSQTDLSKTLSLTVWGSILAAMVLWGCGVFFFSLAYHFNEDLTVGTAQLASGIGMLLSVVPYMIYLRAQVCRHTPAYPHLGGFMAGAFSASGNFGAP